MSFGCWGVRGLPVRGRTVVWSTLRLLRCCCLPTLQYARHTTTYYQFPGFCLHTIDGPQHLETRSMSFGCWGVDGQLVWGTNRSWSTLYLSQGEPLVLALFVVCRNPAPSPSVTRSSSSVRPHSTRPTYSTRLVSSLPLWADRGVGATSGPLCLALQSCVTQPTPQTKINTRHR